MVIFKPLKNDDIETARNTANTAIAASLSLARAV
jgi:hypothetical protein